MCCCILLAVCSLLMAPSEPVTLLDMMNDQFRLFMMLEVAGAEPVECLVYTPKQSSALCAGIRLTIFDSAKKMLAASELALAEEEAKQQHEPEQALAAVGS